jgi:hypothetical protein
MKGETWKLFYISQNGRGKKIVGNAKGKYQEERLCSPFLHHFYSLFSKKSIFNLRKCKLNNEKWGSEKSWW